MLFKYFYTCVILTLKFALGVRIYASTHSLNLYHHSIDTHFYIDSSNAIKILAINYYPFRKFAEETWDEMLFLDVKCKFHEKKKDVKEYEEQKPDCTAFVVTFKKVEFSLYSVKIVYEKTHEKDLSKTEILFFSRNDYLLFVLSDRFDRDCMVLTLNESLWKKMAIKPFLCCICVYSDSEKFQILFRPTMLPQALFTKKKYCCN